MRISKRILILLLCTTLVSGTCFNKHKLPVNATSVVVGASAWTLYEICLYVGTLIASGIGIGFVVDNRDQIAAMGKDFIDSCNLDNLSGWTLAKANTAGQSYVYGTEALQEVKNTTFEVIQGGGASPENNDDNDGDGDVDFDDRTLDLQKIGMWATATFANFIDEQIQPLLDKVNAGEETFLDSYFELSPYTGEPFTGYQKDADGNYIYSAVQNWIEVGGGSGKYQLNPSYAKYEDPRCLIYDGKEAAGMDRYLVYMYKYDALINTPAVVGLSGDYYVNDLVTIEKFNIFRFFLGTELRGGIAYADYDFSTSLPIFSSRAAAEAYFTTGDLSGCVNALDHYRIADWLQENWQGSIDAVNTGIRSIYDNMLIVGESLNQAMINQLNGLGFIEDLLARLAAALPLSLPETVEEPTYYPETSPDPKPDTFPWIDPEPLPNPFPDPAPLPDPTPEPEPDLDEDLDIQNYALDLRQIFPFCIPFDLIALFDVLDAEPLTPRFNIPFVVPSLNLEEEYVIDLSFMDDSMVILRKLELIGFIIGLMVLTGKVIKW